MSAPTARTSASTSTSLWWHTNRARAWSVDSASDASKGRTRWARPSMGTNTTTSTVTPTRTRSFADGLIPGAGDLPRGDAGRDGGLFGLRPAVGVGLVGRVGHHPLGSAATHGPPPLRSG